MLAMVFLNACTQNNINDVKQFEAAEEKPSEIAKDVQLLYSDSARLKIRLESPVIWSFKGASPTKEFPEGLKVWFFNADGDTTSELSAGYALKFDDDGITEMRKDVTVINERGEILNTELLIWDEREGRIHTPAFVKVTSGEEVLFGEGLEADEQLEQYEIQNITGTIILDEEDN